MRGKKATEVSYKFSSENQAARYAYNQGFISRSGNVFFRRSDMALAILLQDKNGKDSYDLFVIGDAQCTK